MRRIAHVAARRGLLLLLPALCLGAAGPLWAQSPVQIGLEVVGTGLTNPTAIAHAGDGSGRLFINQQAGEIRLFDGMQVLPTPFLDISPLVSSGGERGLLGTAFHPNYSTTGFFYVNYTDLNGDTVVARYQVSGNPNQANPLSASQVLFVDQPFANHNGGQLQFGPDGFLYIGMGDGGSSGDPNNRAQNLGDLLGKMLRVDVVSGAPYSIPPTNPFVSTLGARGEVWARGLRNPWRFSFDRKTGDLLIADVGQANREEVDFQPASSPGGENYGWRLMEGTLCFNPDTNCNDGTLVLPVLEYDHSAGRCSITGGYRYRGTRFPQLDGMYLYADFCTGEIWGARNDEGVWSTTLLLDTNFFIATFGEDEAGEVYVADYGGGILYRIVVTNTAAPTLETILPSTARAGGSEFTLAVEGSNFVPGAEVRWNGAARPTTYVSSGRLTAVIPASDIASEGSAGVSAFNPAPGGGSSNSLTFTITPSPRLNAGGAVNAASFAAGAPLAAGSIAAVFGTDLATSTALATAVPLPTTLGGATMLVNASLAVPKFFASSLQVNVQIPWEFEGQMQASLTDTVEGVTSNTQGFSLATFAPGVFTAAANGSGQGAVLVANTGILAAPQGAFPGSRPVQRGEFLEIYCTGLGPVGNRPATGAAASSNPFSTTLTLPTVTIGGRPATVSFSGLSPGFVGLYQVNVQVPADAPSGSAVPLVLTIGGVVANTVTIAVQ